MYCLLTPIRSLDDHPDHPAFKGGREKRPNQVHALAIAVMEMARAMTSTGGTSSTATPTGTASPAAPTVSNGSGISPGKIANLRSNYLQQMRDLHSLFESGAITECELREQKLPILDQLKKLSS